MILKILRQKKIPKVNFRDFWVYIFNQFYTHTSVPNIFQAKKEKEKRNGKAPTPQGCCYYVGYVMCQNHFYLFLMAQR